MSDGGLGTQALYRGIRSWGSDGVSEKSLEALNTFGPFLIGRTTPIPTRFLEVRGALNAETGVTHVAQHLGDERGRGVTQMSPPPEDGAA
eukprot:7226970-Pyramimonas_sp.AAC.1